MLEKIADPISFQSEFTRALETYGFIMPSYEIYGGIAGFFDLGPNGCRLKQNIIERWRNYFVIHDSMTEIECSSIVPESVLKASGHVDRFTDLMVTDEISGSCFRADHLLKENCEKNNIESSDVNFDESDPEKMQQMLRFYRIKAPATGNELSYPYHHNLMFPTSVGATNSQRGYLRPETAPGIFTNFKRLYQQNGNKLPLAIAQIGNSYRNEITPRNGLLRVREFTQAEIEYFYDPEQRLHSDLESVYQMRLIMMPNVTKICQEISLKEAIASSLIKNEVMAYFIGRTYLYLKEIGIDPIKIRFRQHNIQEMAHYAADCWDAEIRIQTGWIECVGIADRSDFDLRCHDLQSKKDLSASVPLDEPVIESTLKLDIDRKILGTRYRGDGKILQRHLETRSVTELSKLKDDLAVMKAVSIFLNGTEFTITPDLLKIYEDTNVLHSRRFFAHAIEPSFGIGRIMHCLLEHTLYRRSDDHERSVFRFKARIAPVKASILPLLHRKEYQAVADNIHKKLATQAISTSIDLSGTTIGRKYARADANGIPFHITIDADSMSGSRSVTIRERDSKEQLRIPIKDICTIICDLSSGKTDWQIAKTKYPMIKT